MRNKLFCIILIVLFMMGLGELFLPQKQFSKIEKRELNKNNDFDVFNCNLEEILKDQFCKRDLVIKEYYKAKLAFNNIPYLVLNMKNDNGFEYKYLGKNVIAVDNDFLLNDILTYDDEKMEICKSKAFNINEMDNKYPNIKTYVFFPTKLEETIDFKDNYGMKYREAFLEQLNENISYSELKNIEDYADYFYKTDFHWNGKGAYEAYKDIINMISEDFDIDKPKQINNIKVYNYKWTGNIASEIGGNWPGENIVDIEVEYIGPYKYYINDKQSDFGKEKISYELYGNNTMYSDYDFFHGNNYFEKRFEFNNEAKPNLLVFCDSLSNVNQEWIASHFNTTIYIDLRSNDGSFNLDEYINKYNVDIIMVSQHYNNLYFNGYMFIPLS